MVRRYLWDWVAIYSQLFKCGSNRYIVFRTLRENRCSTTRMRVAWNNRGLRIWRFFELAYSRLEACNLVLENFCLCRHVRLFILTIFGPIVSYTLFACKAGSITFLKIIVVLTRHVRLFILTIFGPIVSYALLACRAGSITFLKIIFTLARSKGEGYEESALFFLYDKGYMT